MRPPALLVVAALGLLVATGTLSRSQAAAVAGPADFTYSCPNGDVTFSHAKHLAKFPVCTECHPTPFGMARTELGMQKAHAGCAKCHKAGGPAPTDLAAANGCANCHKPKS